MITYSNIIEIGKEDFGAYLARPGFSHSFLKAHKGGEKEYFHVTDNVTIGKIVDIILTGEVDAEIYEHRMYEYCVRIAQQIKDSFGPLLASSRKQIAYTADISAAGLTMPTKGVLDLLIPNFAVIDLKITKSKDVRTLTKFMGYENQLWHYARLANVKRAYLLFYSIPLGKCELIEVDVTSDVNHFWLNAILDFGKVC